MFGIVQCIVAYSVRGCLAALLCLLAILAGFVFSLLYVNGMFWINFLSTFWALLFFLFLVLFVFLGGYFLSFFVCILCVHECDTEYYLFLLHWTIVVAVS